MRSEERGASGEARGASDGAQGASDGMGGGEKSVAVVTVRMTPKMHFELGELANVLGISMNLLCVGAIRRLINEHRCEPWDAAPESELAPRPSSLAPPPESMP